MMRLETETVQLAAFAGRHNAGGSVYTLTLAGVLTGAALDELAASDPSVLAWLDGGDGETHHQSLRTGAARGELMFADGPLALEGARVKSASVKLERDGDDVLATVKLALEMPGDVFGAARDWDARLGQRPKMLLMTGACAEAEREVEAHLSRAAVLD
jgi:hypothetical protein